MHRYGVIYTETLYCGCVYICTYVHLVYSDHVFLVVATIPATLVSHSQTAFCHPNIKEEKCTQDMYIHTLI